MNVSKDHGFVLLSPVRTGGRRAFMALQQDCGLQGGDRRADGTMLSHEIAVPQNWTGSVVATIRDPYTRAVSIWAWLLGHLKQGHSIPGLSPSETARGLRDFLPVLLRTIPSQASMLRGPCTPTNLIRFHRAHSDYAMLPWTPRGKDMSIRTIRMPTSRLTDQWRELLDHDAKRLIEAQWGDDLRRWGYLRVP